MTDADNRPSVVVLLGASNVTLAWPRIISQIEARFRGPRKICTAHGMGRSYHAARSGFAFRQLPGILGSSLWDELARTSSGSACAAALITDLGNDLLYGSSPEEITRSADECLSRIRGWNEDTRIVITRPPVESVAKLGPFRFRFFRTIIFPKCRLTLADTQCMTCELDERIEELACHRGIPVLRPAPEWYGVDPIHVRRRHQSEAFGAMMDLWNLSEPDAVHTAGPRHSRPTAAKRWVLGSEKRTAQPVIRCGGTSVYAY